MSWSVESTGSDASRLVAVPFDLCPCLQRRLAELSANLTSCMRVQLMCRSCAEALAASSVGYRDEGMLDIAPRHLEAIQRFRAANDETAQLVSRFLLLSDASRL